MGPAATAQKSRISEIVSRVLESLGLECAGVRHSVVGIQLSDGISRPAVILKWDPSIHPKTIYDPPQAIVLENVSTGAPVNAETLYRVIREKIEHMLKCDSHAHKEFTTVSGLPSGEEKDALLRAMDRQCRHTRQR